MRISIEEFRQMMEDHSTELRQAQDDYNQMFDDKEAEIKRLELKLDATQDAFREFMEHCVAVIKTNTNGGYVSDALDSLVKKYNDLRDGLAGY